MTACGAFHRPIKITQLGAHELIQISILSTPTLVLVSDRGECGGINTLVSVALQHLVLTKLPNITKKWYFDL